jgi:preprotein translocase subunit SecA
MAAPGGRADPGFYPERESTRQPALDRMVSGVAFELHAALGRRLRAPARLVQTVEEHAERLRAAPLAPQVAQLRYRLRRDGLARGGLAESLGAYCAALPPETPQPTGEALAAAQALVQGGIVDLADPDARRQALALAATAFTLCGVPVHLYCASDTRAREMAAALGAPLRALGFEAACVAGPMDAEARRAAYAAAVTCGTMRAIAFDYLRDRLRLGRRQRPLQGRLERMAGDAAESARLMLGGLRCALVEDADLVLIDDARTPLVVSAEASSGTDRMLYEQALELARALLAGEDYEVDEVAPRLTGRGAQRLAQLSMLLGGAWSSRQVREDLVAGALTALHAMHRGRDYEVAQGTLQLPEAAPDAPPAPEPLRRMLEVKEGLPFAGRRETLTRLPVPAFFRRYLRLAGVCADARGLEREFWRLYGLRCARSGAPGVAASGTVRVFASTAQRRAALASAVHEHAARGEAVVVAARDPREAEALAGMLGVAVMRGAGGDAVQAALDTLARPGAVAVSLHPAQRGILRAAGAPLHLAVADLHESARHVAQIAEAFGASSCTQFLALEDEGFAASLGAPAQRLADAADASGELPAETARELGRGAQRGAERAAARERLELAQREQSLDDLLAFSGRGD